MRLMGYPSGFMKHLPNLLKQESSSAATLVHILLRMYYDPRPEHQAARPQVAERLLPYAPSRFSCPDPSPLLTKKSPYACAASV